MGSLLSDEKLVTSEIFRSAEGVRGPGCLAAWTWSAGWNSRPRQAGYSALDVADLTAEEVRSHELMAAHLELYRREIPQCWVTGQAAGTAAALAARAGIAPRVLEVADLQQELLKQAAHLRPRLGGARRLNP